MAEVTSALIKELREKTFAGMMDCKKALEATGGDLEAAADWLRQNGLVKAGKKTDRVAASGLVAVATKEGFGVVLEVNAETDFVAKNEKFQDMVKKAVKVALDNGGDFNKTAETMKDDVVQLIATIGENMNVRRLASIKGDVVSSYVHNTIAPNLGQIGVIVGLNGADKEKLAEIGPKIAMHIAGLKPDFATIADVSEEVIEKEKAFQREKALESGKPAEIVEKMLEGRIKKFYEEIVLTEQDYVMNPDIKVKQLLADNGATLTGFVRFLLGDGIQKREDNLADEVSKMMK